MDSSYNGNAILDQKRNNGHAKNGHNPMENIPQESMKKVLKLS